MTPQGAQLSLYLGPMVATRAAPHVIEALESIEVTNSAGQRSGFQLAFRWAQGSRLDRDLLAGRFDPMTRVIVAVTLRGAQHVLVDGLITHQQMAPSNQAGGATFTVTGEDVSVAMNLTDLTGRIPYPAMPDFARVRSILAKYAPLGVVALVIPSPFSNVDVPTERFDTHAGTDLEQIEALAADTGYVFYVTAGPAVGTSVAYWGPEIRWGEVQPALSIGMDAHTNVESLSFGYDGIARTLPVVTVQRATTPASAMPVPVPDIGLLRPPLAARRPPPLRTRVLTNTANLSMARAFAKALAVAVQGGDAVTGSGQLDVSRYGRVLAPRQLVDVRGAGIAYDGRYFVRSVTSSIARGRFTQRFQIAREGLMPTTPGVRT